MAKKKPVLDAVEVARLKAEADQRKADDDARRDGLQTLTAVAKLKAVTDRALEAKITPREAAVQRLDLKSAYGPAGFGRKREDITKRMREQG